MRQPMTFAEQHAAGEITTEQAIETLHNEEAALIAQMNAIREKLRLTYLQMSQVRQQDAQQRRATKEDQA